MKNHLGFQILLLSSTSLFSLTTGVASSAAPSPTSKAQLWTPGTRNGLIRGNQPLAAWSRENEICFEYPLYTVIERSERFLDLRISAFSGKVKCNDIDRIHTIAPVFQVRNDAEFFAGLIGSHLITDTGTGTDGRVLTIYDLKSGSKPRIIDNYYGDLNLRKGTQLYFWMTSSNTTATPQNCVIYKRNAAQSLGSAIETQIFLDLKDNTMHKTNRHRCNTRQTPLH